MHVILKKLTLSNFKGIKEREIDFSGHTNISGDNATGKSTIFDAYSWLLWGKDSFNRKDYEIKPYDENNEVIHNLESTVEGTFDVDGKDIKFKRVYKEIWSKKRGSNTETFTGHTTDFYINEVPKKKKEYEEEIEKIVSEDEFNLLSNPHYFNNILDKKDRRKILLSLVDDVSADDVIGAKKELKDLDLEHYSIDEIQAMAKASSKKINDKLKEIPARIDELEKTKTTEDFTEIEKEKSEIQKSIDDIDKDLAGTKDVGKEIEEKQKAMTDLLSECHKITGEFENNKAKLIKEAETDLNDIRRKITAADYEIENLIDRKKTLEKYQERTQDSINKYKKDMEILREKWKNIQLEKFDGNFICPTCGKEFDPEKKDEILKHFNLDKSKRLEEIGKDGQYCQSQVKTLEEELEANKEELEEIQSKLLKISDARAANKIVEAEQEEKLDKARKLELCDKALKEIDERREKSKAIQKEIDDISKVDNTQKLEQKQVLVKSLDEINTKLSNQGLNAKLDEKISKYEKEEKDLAIAYEGEQYKLFLCDEYTKTYAELVNDKINKLFNFVEFKLFDTQINGGIVEVADATYGGVPYGSLNSAAQINAGLDVIKALSKHFEKQIPIFVDNAESVNKLIDVDSQLITLTVSKLKNLKVEEL
ncbi:AAA family ATPase [Anaerococcus sp. NML200537]|uniref:ATP-binding protein n=1 Tax=Anaerococcus sp. NML200537 TaxID=2954485 RepID=UPI00223911CE|nr:ATP-binding protein [Anaerococcus sp. NML200537]MCW6701444.1 AAA family ATPase [Anaerococcus sp. NML200537]